MNLFPSQDAEPLLIALKEALPGAKTHPETYADLVTAWIDIDLYRSGIAQVPP